MKPFFWSVVPVQDLDATIFKQIDDANAKIDKAGLEKLFATAAPAAKKAPGDAPAAAAKPVVPAKKEEVTLIDPKRSYAVNIALSRFKMPFPSIRDALLSLDERALDEEKIAALTTIAPTNEELETIKDYVSPTNMAKLPATDLSCAIGIQLTHFFGVSVSLCCVVFVWVIPGWSRW